MKKLFILFIFTIIAKISIAQTPIPLEANKTLMDYTCKSVIINNNMYYFKLNFNYDSTHARSTYSKIGIVKINEKMNTKVEKNLIFDSTKLYSMVIETQVKNNFIYAILMEAKSNYFDMTVNSIHQEYIPYLIKLDTNLNLVFKNEIKLKGQTNGINFIFNIFSDSIAVITYNVNSTFPNNPVSSLININTADTIKTYINTTILNQKNWVITKDSLLHLIDDNGDYYTLDKNFNFIDKRYFQLKPTAYSLGFSYSNVYFKNLPLYYNTIDSSNIETSVIYTYDYYTNKYNLIYSEPLPNSVYVNGAFYGIDVLDTSYIFTTYFEAGKCPTTNFSVDCKNTFEINKINSQGVLQWKKTIGGDASYQVYQIIATADSGCLAIMGRFQYGFNNNENDMYYLKLDKDGNQQLNYLPTSINNFTIEDKLIVYPNPANDYLFIKNENVISNNSKYVILSFDGKEIFSNTLNKNSIAINELSNGIYFLKIIDSNNKISVTKFIKN